MCEQKIKIIDPYAACVGFICLVGGSDEKSALTKNNKSLWLSVEQARWVISAYKDTRVGTRPKKILHRRKIISHLENEFSRCLSSRRRLARLQVMTSNKYPLCTLANPDRERS
jgi:hypothetical protein